MTATRPTLPAMVRPTEEITQVIANGPTYRQNRRGRSADLLAFGLTDGGRAIVVAVAWDAASRTIRPITAWER